MVMSMYCLLSSPIVSISPFETTRMYDHGKAAIGGLRASVYAELRKRVEEVGDGAGAAHGLVAVNDKGPVSEGDVADE